MSFFTHAFRKESCIKKVTLFKKSIVEFLMQKYDNAFGKSACYFYDIYFGKVELK